MAKHQIVSRWNALKVLFECELPEGIESGLAMRRAPEKAVATGSDLRDAYLRGADLSEQKNDFWSILLRAPREIAGLRLALVEGRVDGSTYEGTCSCLVGSIANIRGVDYQDVGNGISPNASRPAERWFMGIRKGDTPETNQISRITVEWLDEFAVLLNSAQVPA